MTLAAAQGAATLRIRVVLTDASGVATPIPRLVLLVSDNPPTDEPRRVRTTADGTIELKLAPGSYLVELDEPVAFRGKAYTWTQIVEVAAGRETLLDLTAANAEAAAGARISADSATLLTAWRDSVVEIWTPTTHASGFVIDAARGLIATSHHALANATSVEVQFTAGKERFKVRRTGDRVGTRSRRGGRAGRSRGGGFGAPDRSRVRGSILANGELQGRREHDHGVDARPARRVSDGLVTRTTSQAIFSDLRVGSDSEGGPVFAESGALLRHQRHRRRQGEPRAGGARHGSFPLSAHAASSPPQSRRSPTPRPHSDTSATRAGRAGRSDWPRAQLQRHNRPTVSASAFDITLLTPAQVTDNSKGQQACAATSATGRSTSGTWARCCWCESARGSRKAC